jgi:hypothetical protein
MILIAKSVPPLLVAGCTMRFDLGYSCGCSSSSSRALANADATNPVGTAILPRIKICGKEIFPLISRQPIMLGLSND